MAPSVGVFDDPEAEYRVLYASSQRLGCFLETLASFRLDVALIAELAAIGGEDDFVPAGVVPVEWLHNRLIGSAYIPGAYGDVGASDWIGHLRTELAREVVALGVPDFDAAGLQRSAPRKLTISRLVNDRGLDGVRYLSRYGHDLENWAVFEPLRIEMAEMDRVTAEDSDFQLTLQIHGLQLSSNGP
jgi:hypothetical protein